jgi:hypothetical protein
MLIGPYTCYVRIENRCGRDSLSIFTSVLFIGEFLAKSNAKMSFSDSTYSEMS